ncbi:MAG: pilin [Candidatus Andersenbacteria bacterium]|nr:pilin [Candidatus Andersenbacteria bacterium]
MKYLLPVIVLAVFVFGVSCAPVRAQSGGDPQGFNAGLDSVKQIAGQNGLNNKQQTTKEILQTIVAWLTSLLATVALISLVYGGYLYISSQGDEGNVSKGKAILLYSIIGLIIVGLAGVIVNVVISVATQ